MHPSHQQASGMPLAYRKSSHDTQTTTQHGSKRHCERVRSEHTPSTLSAVHALYDNLLRQGSAWRQQECLQLSEAAGCRIEFRLLQQDDSFPRVQSASEADHAYCILHALLHVPCDTLGLNTSVSDWPEHLQRSRHLLGAAQLRLSCLP